MPEGAIAYRESTTATSQLQGEPGAEGIAQHVHPPQTKCIQIGLYHISQGLHRGPPSERGRPPVAGQVHSQHVVVRRQPRAQRAAKSSRVLPMPCSSTSGSPLPARSQSSTVFTTRGHYPLPRPGTSDLAHLGPVPCR